MKGQPYTLALLVCPWSIWMSRLSRDRFFIYIYIYIYIIQVYSMTSVTSVALEYTMVFLNSYYCYHLILDVYYKKDAKRIAHLPSIEGTSKKTFAKCFVEGRHFFQIREILFRVASPAI